MNSKAPWKIEWTDELSVGIPEIDDEHRRFIDLLNSINAAIRERATVNTLEAMMENAIADIRDHYRHEEQLFEQYDYEGRDEHAQLHAQAIGRLDDMSAAFKASISDSERIQIGLDIKNLLVSHLLDEDMKYRGMQHTHHAAGDELGATNPAWSARETEYMRAALAEASVAAVEGEVPVGAVVVIDDEIVATGYNRSIHDADPSAHAEIIAMRAAADEIGNHRLTNATLYVTLEPCVMCVGAIAQARVGRVVFGAYDRKAGALGSVEDLSDSRALNHRFDINGGLLDEACAQLIKAFFEARR